MEFRFYQVWCRTILIGVIIFIHVSSVNSVFNINNSRLDNITEYHGGVPEVQENYGLAVEPRHRQKMMFPLLLNIASRLAQAVLLALASLASTIFMGFVAKKAFILSIAAFGLMIYDIYYKKKNTSTNRTKHYYIAEPDVKASTYYSSDPVFGF